MQYSFLWLFLLYDCSATSFIYNTDSVCDLLLLILTIVCSVPYICYICIFSLPSEWCMTYFVCAFLIKILKLTIWFFFFFLFFINFTLYPLNKITSLPWLVLQGNSIKHLEQFLAVVPFRAVCVWFRQAYAPFLCQIQVNLTTATLKTCWQWQILQELLPIPRLWNWQ